MGYLTPCLYSHRPIDLVIISLGCNDLKTRHSLSPSDIALGVASLVHGVKQSAAGLGEAPPRVLVLSPPKCRETEINLEWGFHGCEEKSVQTISSIGKKCQQLNVPFVDLSQVANVGTDGIHFSVCETAKIGAHMV